MRISPEKWNKRLEEVKLASEDCRTIEELIEITDYSRYIIKQLFKKFPEEAKEIQDNLEKNNDKTKKKKSRKINNKTRLTKILEASKTCKSFVELSKITGFSDFIIRNILAKFPDEEAIVRENLAKNKGKQKTKCKAENIDELDAKKEEKVIMLDTSVCNVKDMLHFLEKYVQQGYTLGITDIVLDELDNLQKSECKSKKAACKLLHIIKDNISSFKLFELKSEEEQNSNDELLIKACKKENTILLTLDKVMHIKASLKGIKSECVLYKDDEELQEELKFNSTNVNAEKKPNKKNLERLCDATVTNGKLIFLRNNRKSQFNKVFSRTGEEKQGTEIVLEVGDHIFICSAKEDYITFADYEVYTTSENIFYMRYNCRSYITDVIVNVNNPKYKKFIEQARKALIKE